MKTTVIDVSNPASPQRVGGYDTSGSALCVAVCGYFTHVAGVENVFGGTPNNASTAFFTFMNKLSTTTATPHGPLTVVDRKGTTTIYLNPAGGASFENPATPVALAVPRERSHRLTVATPAWLSLGRGGVTIFTVN